MEDMDKIKRNPVSESIANEILKNYNPESVEDMQEALKDIFGPMFKGLLKGELNHHLGYESNSKGTKSTNNRRNGSTPKTLKTSMGEVTINSPRDRDSSFEPQIIPKRTKDVSAMYARGMSQRYISSTINDIYGFEMSHEMISQITDVILPEVEEWRNRPLKKCYPFIFVDCMYVTVRSEYDNYLIDQILDLYNIKRSLSHKGNPYDNAVAESGFKTIKFEFVYPRRFETLQQLELELATYVYWYNNIRLHSTLNYMSPVEYKKKLLNKTV